MTWLFGVGVPILLAVLGYRLSSRPKTLFALVVLVAAGVVMVELAISKGELRPGSTWLGYGVILLAPFLFATLGIEATRRSRSKALKMVMAFVGIPLLFWLGVVVGLSVAVTLGWASP